MVINHLPPGPGGPPGSLQLFAGPWYRATVQLCRGAGSGILLRRGARFVGQGKTARFFFGGVGKTLGVATWEGHEKKMHYICD